VPSSKKKKKKEEEEEEKKVCNIGEYVQTQQIVSRKL
jgi:hypothetical protein